MASCCVPNCNVKRGHNTYNNETFHRFPKRPAELREKWIRAVNRPNWSPFKSSKVCSKHFEQKCFILRSGSCFLAKDAVPTLFLPPREPDIAACLACLATDCPLYDIRECGLHEAFFKLSDIPVTTVNEVRHLCQFCYSELSKYVDFRDRCHHVHELLETLRKWGPLKMDYIRALDRDALKLTRNLTKTAVDIVVTTETENFLSTPVKTEKDDIDTDSMSDYADIKEFNEESKCFYETSLIEEIKDTDTNEVIVKQEEEQSTLENLKDSEVSAKVTTDTGNIEDIVKQEMKRSTLRKQQHSEVSAIATKIDTGNIEDTEKQEMKRSTLRKRQDSEVSAIATKIDTGDIEDIEKQEIKRTTLKKRKHSKVSAKATKIDSGNNADLEKQEKKKTTLTKRKFLASTLKIKIGDDFYPDYDYKVLENEYRVKITLLNKDEQKAEVEARKLTSNYLDSPHRCDLCGKGFNHFNRFTNHMSYHDHSVGPFECEICHIRFATQRTLSIHLRKHRLRFTCQECGCVTRTITLARTHFEIHAGKTYKCPHCPREFNRSSSRFDHARIEHPGLNVACDQCGETFISAYGITVHKNKAHRKNIKHENFKCPTCDVSFNSLEALDKHTSTAPDSHTAVAPCAVCGENCESEAALSEHTALRHPPDQYRCHECEATFSSAAAFETHDRRKHLGLRRPQDHSRQRGGTGRRPARRPPRPRRPPAPHTPGETVCETCGKVVQSEIKLKYHRRVHDKPFKCTHCPKTFSAKHSRDWHIRTHTGERPFQCKECPLAFAMQCNLKRHHQVVHLNQRKSFPCPLCGKTFSAKSCVKLHIDTVHNHMPGPKRKRRRKEPDDNDSA